MRTPKLDVFTTAYVECALWTEYLDTEYGALDIVPESLLRIMADCAAFQDANWPDIAEDMSRAGHDFWLTRNGHGCGFWDRSDWSADVGDRLTVASEAFGECELYIGDDGRIYLS